MPLPLNLTLREAIRTRGLPEKVTIDQSGSNTAAITHYHQTHTTAIIIRLHISQQRRGARPSSGQTHYASHAGLQVLLGGVLYDCRH